jgi:hypothetical protein
MLKAELQKIADMDGVVALGFRKKGDAQVHVTPHRPPALIETGWDWRGLLEATAKILDVVEDKSVRVQIDAHVCNATEEDGHVLVVLTEKGHPIAKSVQRTIRRGLKHIRKHYPVKSPQAHYVDTFTKPAMERRTPEFLRTPPASPVADPEPGTPEPVVDQKTKKIEP